MNLRNLTPIACVLVLLMVVSGCNSQPDSTASPATPAEPTSAAESHDGHSHDAGDDHSSSGSEMDAMMKELVSFSEEDRASVIKQHMCPVSDQMLGSMGAPEKVDVNGQAVWICCDGCKDKLLADPDKYLAKLTPSDAASHAE